MLDVGDGVRRGVEGSLGVSVVLGIEGEAVELSLDVVPQDSHLAETSVEGLGGGDVGYITETEDVVVGLVLEGGGVDVQVSSVVGKAGLGEDGVSGGGHERVEVSIGSLDELSGSGVLEDSHIVALNNMFSTFLTSTSSRLVSMLIP